MRSTNRGNWRGFGVAGWLASAAGLGAASGSALAQTNWEENPPVMLQWFECPWQDMERRMPDWFAAGYGSVWLPPVSKGYVWPGLTNQNSTSAGYDVFDRFDLGSPNRRTAYGTESGFDAVVAEYHRANGQVLIDMVVNHNAARQGSAGFMNDGGYPGFWMNPPSPMRDKLSNESWGDFHGGFAGGYYQSTNPNDPNYCLLSGDLVALIDIDQGSVNSFIRQPVEAGNPLNLPGGTYFNKVDANNRRFYPDAALGTSTVNNPGMWFAGALTTGSFAPPCDVPARNEPATQYARARFNLGDKTAGDAVAENATGYLLRWVQWMVDVKKVDGFRIDAIKHVPSWFFDSYFDAVVAGSRETPDGRFVTPYSFGECVEGNDFTFDRYVRKPNGRTSGRLVAGDAFGNRDALDLNGAGALRNLISGGGLGSWNNVTGVHLDNTDDGFNNGSIGVNHIFSHDNGSQGNGSSVPAIPTYRQQGWYAHAYLFLRPGQAKIYHNARLVGRTGSGFYPREGQPLALGFDPTANATSPTVTRLVQLSNWFGRGEYTPRWQDGDVLVFERRKNTGAGYSGNCLVVLNDRYDGGFDTRTVSTSFPAGTRLIEYTGNAADPVVDPTSTIDDVIVVGAGGQATVRAPRNLNSSNVEHNKGYLLYAPAIPAGTLSILGASGSIAPDATGLPGRKRLATIPIITGNSFTIDLVTTNGDAGAANNDNADDNAVFRINEGYRDDNSSGGVDIDHTNAVVPGYEQFVTLREPLANTANTQGHYQQTIDATTLPEGMNYISVVAFRKRNSNESPLFRELRTTVYVDRSCPSYEFVQPAPPITGTSGVFSVRALDRTLSQVALPGLNSSGVHIIANPPVGVDPVTLATLSNAATRVDRFDWTRIVTGLQQGLNRIAVVTFEESQRGCSQEFLVLVGDCVADVDDGSGTGIPDGGVTIDDLIFYLNRFDAGC